MTLKKEDRNAIVLIRIERAKKTMSDVYEYTKLGHWRTAANRLYYACYYAASALLVKNGFTTRTHSGVITQLGLHFVKEGLISREQGHFFKELFDLRQDGDYDDLFDINEQDVIPFVEPAEKFIQDIENLITQKHKDMPT